MANKENQSRQYRIYIKEYKNWVDVNKEFYTSYYRDINAYRASASRNMAVVSALQASVEDVKNSVSMEI